MQLTDAHYSELIKRISRIEKSSSGVLRIKELPFSRPHFLKLEREGKLKSRLKDGIKVVLQEDLIEYFKGE